MRRGLGAFVLIALILSGPLAAGQDAGPAFPVRGALLWHNFLSGPTAWDEPDWERYLDNMKRLGLNLLVLHCYTGGAQRYAPYVEPMIRMEYRNVLPEAGFDTSLTARWGYRPLAVQDFAFDTGKLFPKGMEAFGSSAALLARTNDDRYRRAQALIRRVFEMAHARGIRVAMGFEFGIYPPEFASIVPQDSYIPGAQIPDPTHPASIEILQLTIEDVLRAYPGVDWIWLWLHEHTDYVGKGRPAPAFQAALDRGRQFFGANEQTAFAGVWSLEYIKAAREYIARRAPKTRVAIGGWGGGSQLPAILAGLDRALPLDVVFTCLNPNQGEEPPLPVLAEIARRREVWAVPWLEGDAKLWHPQPRVSLLREHVQMARKQGLKGVVAIHWRTEETRANMEAFARAARDPQNAPSVSDFYAQDCKAEYGDGAGRELAPLLARMDAERWFEPLQSPEYFPYNPGWGRLTPGLRDKVAAALQLVQRLTGSASEPRHRKNLEWLAANLRFTLLLGEAGRAIEPAYNLKADWFGGALSPEAFAERRPAALKALESAPVKELFQTYASRVRSRGELGVLSSLNQRLWLQYVELKTFLASPVP